MTRAVNIRTIRIAQRCGAEYIEQVQLFDPERINFESFVEELVRKCASFCSDSCDAEEMLNYFGYDC